MSNTAGLPFQRGTTYHGTSKTLSDSYGTSVGLEGHIGLFKDTSRKTASGAATPRSDRIQTCMIVRNVSGLTLAPKRLALWAAGYIGRRVGGYAKNAGDGGTFEPVAGVVDELLPSTGVRNYDLFWLQVKGPALCYTSISNMAADVGEGTPIVAQTAATSQAATAGYVQGLVANTYTTLAVGQIAAIIGRAMSSKLTSATSAEILVELDLLKS